MKNYNFSFFAFLHNLIFQFRYKIKYYINYENKLIVDSLNYEIENLRHEINFLKVINHYNNNESTLFSEEIKYLRTNDSISVFPYPQLKNLKKTTSGFDADKRLPYVTHNAKKLYFPKSWSVEQAENTYKYFIETENILGGNYSTKDPHNYQSKNVCVEEGDTLIDLGAAEALFSLDMIDTAKKIYIVEGDSRWIEALEATFEPFKHKVKIINKYISISTNDSKNTDFKSIIEGEVIESLFIKMDIEGSETTIIKANNAFFDLPLRIKMACCTYHKQEDAEVLFNFFEAKKYHIEFSDGYMLFYTDKSFAPPYFRKGIIRVTNYTN